MFDILATMGVAAIGEIMKQSISNAITWAKGRKKPAPDVVDQKVEQIVTDATKKVTPDALSSEDRQRIVEGLIDVVRPTLDQIMEFSPNTQRVVYAARGTGGGVKRSAAKKAAPKKATAKKAAKKFSPGHAAKKRFAGRKSVPKRAR